MVGKCSIPSLVVASQILAAAIQTAHTHTQYRGLAGRRLGGGEGVEGKEGLIDPDRAPPIGGYPSGSLV